MKSTYNFLMAAFIGFAVGALQTLRLFAFACGEKMNDAVFRYMARNGLVQCFGEVPDANTFSRYRVTDPDQSEVIRQRLYDFQLYPQAGQQQFLFFANPVGTGKTSTPGAVAGSAKMDSDTNMNAANMLPSGMEYLIESIEVYFFAGSVNTADTYTPAKLTTDATGALLAASISANNDIQQFYNEGTVSFKVLNKIYLRETPCRSFPPKTWMETDAALATTNATLSLAIGQTRPIGRPYMMEPPVSLQPATNFNIAIDYPAARALPSGFNARVGIVLDGFLRRASQ